MIAEAEALRLAPLDQPQTLRRGDLEPGPAQIERIIPHHELVRQEVLRSGRHQLRGLPFGVRGQRLELEHLRRYEARPARREAEAQERSFHPDGVLDRRLLSRRQTRERQAVDGRELGRCGLGSLGLRLSWRGRRAVRLQGRCRRSRRRKQHVHQEDDRHHQHDGQDQALLGSHGYGTGS